MAGGEDAIRLHNFQDVLIEDNEIFGVIENGGAQRLPAVGLGR